MFPIKALHYAGGELQPHKYRKGIDDLKHYSFFFQINLKRLGPCMQSGYRLAKLVQACCGIWVVQSGYWRYAARVASHLPRSSFTYFHFRCQYTFTFMNFLPLFVSHLPHLSHSIYFHFHFISPFPLLTCIGRSMRADLGDMLSESHLTFHFHKLSLSSTLKVTISYFQ